MSSSIYYMFENISKNFLPSILMILGDQLHDRPDEGDGREAAAPSAGHHSGEEPRDQPADREQEQGGV